jgi:hypothetical protein
MFSKILKEAIKNSIHDIKNSPWCAVLKGSVASLIADKDMIDKLQNQKFSRLV